MQAWQVMATSFVTASVEWVEAFTIVLAVALSVGWRRAGAAAFAAVIVLALLTVLGHGVLSAIANLRILQLVIGVFLSLFGIRWLAKAIARGAGLRALRDEDAAFARLRGSPNLAESHGAFLVAFQGVMVEGLEVWLIVVALGVQTGKTGDAAFAAIAAFVFVFAAGLMLRKPLALVPENTIKFLVGCAILGFGTFWVLESQGYAWPIGDYALPALMGFYAAGGLAMIRFLAPAGIAR